MKRLLQQSLNEMLFLHPFIKKYIKRKKKGLHAAKTHSKKNLSFNDIV